MTPIERNLQAAPASPIPTQPRYPVRRRRLRGWLLVLFLLMLAGAILTYRSDSIARTLPFIVKEAPPIVALHPIVEAKSKELVMAAESLGISVLVTDGFRSHEEQEALYAQGRTTAGPVVTHVRGGASYHNYGLAIDFALLTPKGKAIWDLEYDGNRNGASDWMEVVAIAKRLGFTWGGNWQGFKDYPHLQMDFGYSISELKRGHRPPAEPQDGME
ncbi:M15 family metallopeptidase [Paenibacillus sp. PL2-23]|uniref:M15 family metallopeptidase n=1 Tax=Paenibacillus sp. PL2-23 TaxID=2100729 RepID=UPI0030F64B73